MATVTTLPRGREFTVEDLDSMPDDGNRYELIDGSLIVTPPPLPRHQVAAARLVRVLLEACPPELEVLFAPLGVRISRKTSMQPDVLVTRLADLGTKDLPVAPLLAVEILSPSTRHIDLGLKRSAYEAMGTPAYWVVDAAVPSIIVWELRDGAYVEVGRAVGRENLDLTLPFPVRITPQHLVP